MNTLKALYSVNCKEIITQEERRTAFGIDVIFSDRKLYSVSDITAAPGFVDCLTGLFNREELSPLHFLDVLTDMLP